MATEQRLSKLIRTETVSSFRQVVECSQQLSDDAALSTATVESLTDSIQRSLVGLAEGEGIYRLPPIKRWLTRSAALLVMYKQLDSLCEILENTNLPVAAEADVDSAGVLLAARRDRRERKLRKRCRRLVAKKLEDQIESLDSSELASDDATLALARESLSAAWIRLTSAIDCEDPSLTLIHELHESADNLYYKLDLYRVLLDQEIVFSSLAEHVQTLRNHSSEALHWALVKARCTKWLAKERDGRVIGIMRALVDECRTRHQQEFGEMARFLQTRPFSEFASSGVQAIDQIGIPN